MNLEFSPEEQSLANDKATNTVIPVIEEQLVVDKKIIETGKIAISKHITESVETVNIPLLHNDHIVEHIEINRFVDDAPLIRYDGDTIIIPVLKEVLVKRTLLVEEIRITKHTFQTNEQQQFTLRKENVVVESSKP